MGFLPQGAPPPTKEFFIPAIFGTNGPSISGFWIRQYNDYVGIIFYVPHDFKSIVEAKIICEAQETQTIDVKCHCVYAAEDETQTRYGISYPSKDVVNEKFFSIDISDILTDLAAGDHVRLYVNRSDEHNVMNAYVRGVLFRYA